MESAINATAARQNFSALLDQVKQGSPKAITRNRDIFVAMYLPHVKELVRDIRFTLDAEQEEDGSFSGSLKEVDVMENAPTLEDLKRALAEELIQYSKHYFEDFPLFFNAPNRRHHFPFVLRVQLAKDVDEVVGLIR